MIDINECITGEAKCGPNSTCINTSPGYKCDCVDGYKKINDICTRKMYYYNSALIYIIVVSCLAECTKDCQNGGQCTAPDICTCVPGFTGKYCEDDIDECKDDNLNDCDYLKSTCTNTKGGYFCSCRAGHQTDVSTGTRRCKGK